MKKISGFWTDDKVDVLIDRFEEMVTETETLRLAERLRYALSSQFIDRLEDGGKINSGESQVEGYSQGCRWESKSRKYDGDYEKGIEEIESS